MINTFPNGIHAGSLTIVVPGSSEIGDAKNAAMVSGMTVLSIQTSPDKCGLNCKSPSEASTQMLLDIMSTNRWLNNKAKIYYHNVSTAPNREETKGVKYYLDILSPLMSDLKYIPYFPECYVLDRVGTYGFRALVEHGDIKCVRDECGRRIYQFTKEE